MYSTFKPGLPYFAVVNFNLELQVVMWYYHHTYYLTQHRCLEFEQIQVKVKENWRQDEGFLKHSGYGGQIGVVW
jgi:hypothetical protein